MKKLFAFLSVFFVLINPLSAQVIYEDGFESVVIGPGDYVTPIPSPYITYTDSNHRALSYPYSDPWLVRKFFPEKAVICPTKFYPTAAADRWLITPAISLTANNSFIWRSKIEDSQHPELYQIKLSTTGTDKNDFITLATFNNDSVTYRNHAISLAAYPGQTVHLAIRMLSTQGNCFYLDEIRVEEANAYDASVVGSSIGNFLQLGNHQLTYTVFNNSAHPIHSLDLNYDVNGGPAQTQSYSNLNINSFGTMNFTHFIVWNATNTGYNTVRLWASNINGGADVRPVNDTLTLQIGIVSQIVPKMVMVEEHTGSWCGFCVDAFYHLDLLAGNYPWVIPYAIHTMDQMSFSDGNQVNHNVSIFPTAFFDRYPFKDTDGYGGWGNSATSQWDNLANLRYVAGSPCDVTVTHTYDPNTRVLSGTVNTTFYGNFPGEFRLNLYVVEDSVSEGTGPGWDQNNYYSSQNGAYGGPGHPFYNLPDPIVSYRHRHVCREMLGGAWGAAGSISANGVLDGSQYSWDFSDTLPLNFDPAQISLIGMVQKFDSADYQQRPIYNSVSVPLLEPNAVESIENVSAVSVFPNPAADGNFMLKLNLNTSGFVQWTITDITGKRIGVSPAIQFAVGEHFIPVSESALASGIYFLNIKTGESSQTIRLVSTH